MVRNLLRSGKSWARIGLCVALGLFGSQTWALGLGEIELDSALNERLNARIELLDAAGMQPSEVLVTLASSEDFERVGVERFFYLTGLQFEVEVNGDRAWVNVTSRQPISEPYLNFLVQVHWPSGRLLREYTLLLDPPTYSQAAAPSVSAPQQEAAVGQTAGRIERTPAQTAPPPRTAGTQVDLTPRTTERATMPAGDGEFRMTDRNDTLWKIASVTRPSDRVNVQQQMLALQRLNPEAFIRNNINLLKAGYVMRLPSEDQALSITRSEAAQQVAAQNDAWRNPERIAAAPEAQSVDEPAELRSQVDATDTAPAPDVAQADGQLRIVAGDGDSVVGAEVAEESSEQAAAALEERDRLAREVDELTYQLDREQELAGNQLEIKDRQLEVKDQQIAELQAQLAAARTAAQQLQQNPNQNPPAPEAETPWWQSTPVLGGAAAVLVLSLVGGLVTARRRRSEAALEDDYYDEADEYEEDAEPIVSDDFEDDEDAEEAEDGDVLSGLEVDDLEEVEVEVDEEDDEFDEASEDDTEEVEAVSGTNHVPTGSETGDVIGEADIYIAYGRYPQAIGLLLGVLEQDQGRNDVRLKLLECYVETMDRANFDLQMLEFVERCDDEEALLTAREYEGRLSESEIMPGDDSDTDIEAVADPEPAHNDDVLDSLDDSVDGSADELDAIEDFDLKLDDPEPTADEPESEATPNTGKATSGLEFELELDEQSIDDPAESSTNDLGGDLGMDFDPNNGSSDVTAETEVATSEVEEGFSLDELDDLEVEEEAAEDFDFDDEGDSASTKLDLARAYIDMGDEDGARDILSEVVSEGNEGQQQQAKELLDQL